MNFEMAQTSAVTRRRIFSRFWAPDRLLILEELTALGSLRKD